MPVTASFTARLMTAMSLNLIYGPSGISRDDALSYHGLIRERVSTVFPVASGRSRQFDTPVGTLPYRSLSLPGCAVGADLWNPRPALF